jgi:cysteine desulfurase
VELSHVLLAMGLGVDEVQGSLRFSLGRPTTEAEVDRAAAAVAACIGRQKEAFGLGRKRGLAAASS